MPYYDDNAVHMLDSYIYDMYIVTIHGHYYKCKCLYT